MADLFKQVNFADGEGVDPTDLVNMQQYLESKIWDQILHNSIGSISSATTPRDPRFGGQDGTDHSTLRAYCLTPGGAYLRQGSANNKIQLAPGTILQKVASMTGDTPAILAYTSVGTDEWTIANGDPTNPRVDLLQMQLSSVLADVQTRDFKDAVTGTVSSTTPSKKRRSTPVFTVKAGVPAASPVVPDPDAGFCVVGAVVVGQTWTSAGNPPIFGVDTAAAGNVVVHDHRMPLGVRGYRVSGASFASFISWARGPNLDVSYGPTVDGVNTLVIACPSVDNGRLIAVTIEHNDAVQALGSGGTISLGACDGNEGRLHTYNRFPLSSLTTTPADFYLWDVCGFLQFEKSPTPAAGPTLVASAINNIGAPLWSNGLRCPEERARTFAAGSRPGRFLGLQFLNIPAPGGFGPRVSGVTFYIAEGL